MTHKNRDRNRQKRYLDARVREGLNGCDLRYIIERAETMGYEVNEAASFIQKGGDLWLVHLHVVSVVFKQGFRLAVRIKPRYLKDSLRNDLTPGAKDPADRASRLFADHACPLLFQEWRHIDHMDNPYPSTKESGLPKWLHAMPRRFRLFFEDFVGEFGKTINFHGDSEMARGVCCLLIDEWRSMAGLCDDPEEQLSRIRYCLHSNHPGSALLLYQRYKPEEGSKEGDIALDYILEHLAAMEASGQLKRLEELPLERFALYSEAVAKGICPLHFVPVPVGVDWAGGGVPQASEDLLDRYCRVVDTLGIQSDFRGLGQIFNLGM